MNNPIQPFLNHQSMLVLDGGLATHLETLGCDLSDALWSARLLLDNPGIIQQAHLDYFYAGADVAITASYQATIPGLIKRGLSQADAIMLLQRSVKLAVAARDQFWRERIDDGKRLRPFIAASIGPYGAYLADGSEYSGKYDLGEDALYTWHRPRWYTLAETEADLLACETIPSFAETRALLRLVDDGETAVWFSFSCRDGQHIHDGTPLANCIAHVAKHPQVVAVGVNCTAPQFIPSLIHIMRDTTIKPILVYPNSGETYDATSKRWLGESEPAEFGTYSREWRKLGAALIGGCCRTGPDHIRQIRDRVRVLHEVPCLSTKPTAS
jgi:homocysteine S-methyltransferase